MMRALIHKDFRLQRIYLRLSLIAFIACYVLAYLTVRLYPDISDEASRLFLAMKGGSYYGLVLTYVVASIVAGNAFTLERSDRSAEFLACLPPSRLQNLISKLAVAFLSISAFICLHATVSWISQQVASYAKVTNTSTIFPELPTMEIASLILCAAGISWACSAIVKSNGGPVFCGIISPIIILNLVVGIAKLVDLPLDKEAFSDRFFSGCALLGFSGILCGCFFYLNRTEP